MIYSMPGATKRNRLCQGRKNTPRLAHAFTQELVGKDGGLIGGSEEGNASPEVYHQHIIVPQDKLPALDEDDASVPCAMEPRMFLEVL